MTDVEALAEAIALVNGRTRLDDGFEWYDSPLSMASEIVSALDGYTLVRSEELAGLRAALDDIRETCKPMSMSMTGPVWFDGGTPAGGGSRERIWRTANAALEAKGPRT